MSTFSSPTTQAKRPGPRDAAIATRARWPGLLQRMVERSRFAEWAPMGLTVREQFDTLGPGHAFFGQVFVRSEVRKNLSPGGGLI
jgi:hypothetical protein